MNRISIIIASYNRAETVVDSIDSCLRQSVPDGWDLSLVVVDDGSTDQTRELLVEKYALKLQEECSDTTYARDRLYLIVGPNVERGAARNRGARFGINKLGAQWLIFLDSDDALLEQSVANFIKRIAEVPKNPNVVGLYANYVLSYEKKGLSTPVFCGQQPEGNISIPILTKSLIAMGSNFISASAFQTVGEFSEDRDMSGSEDWHLWCRLAFQGPIYYSDHVSFVYRQHKGSTGGQTFRNSVMRSRIQLIPFLEKRLKDESGKFIRAVLLRGHLLVAGVFNSERQTLQAYWHSILALKTDPLVILRGHYWRLLASISWRGLARQHFMRGVF